MTSVVRASFLISIIFLSACSSDEISNYSGEIYGTSYIIKTTGKPSNDLKEKIDAELNRIDYVFSTYKETSLISKINRNEDVIKTEEFTYVLNLANQIAQDSGGAFDPYDENGLDFSGIAKGYAIDRIGHLLENNAIKNYFIEIGGEVRALGTKYGDNWVFAVEKPSTGEKTPYIAFKTPKKGISVATSGEYREPNHIWGDGPRNILSTTVAAEDAATADAWATALYVLGKEQGLKLANENGLAVIFIDEDGESIQSSSWSMIQL